MKQAFTLQFHHALKSETQNLFKRKHGLRFLPQTSNFSVHQSLEWCCLCWHVLLFCINWPSFLFYSYLLLFFPLANFHLCYKFQDWKKMVSEFYNCWRDSTFKVISWWMASFEYLIVLIHLTQALTYETQVHESGKLTL